MKKDTLTAEYLNNKKKFHIPDKRRKGNGKFLDNYRGFRS